MAKWNAIAYCVLSDNVVKKKSTKYMLYKYTLERVANFEDNKEFQYIYGSDYSINLFFSDVGSVGEDFEEMLKVISYEKIDKVFILDLFAHWYNPLKLGELAQLCRERHIELLMPYQKKDNVAHPEFFDRYADNLQKFISISEGGY
ncbi:hypothetical protein SAMN05421676_10249 [Salinibacillus kushneri]|uniref:Resolvase, N terminal domain n=1 Tax=Salinibacillus kushneri TaxID=237682 RepID=A0A1I0A8N5_9BACI|nr:hypothetical protein [Salinibacillus kushneri]SES89605.1 hypothetical protein SAMN05421676_10249 [Salinibacillus kushneri]